DARPRLHLEGGDVHPLAVDGEVTVAHQLPGLGPGIGEAHAEDDIVQPQLEKLEQGLTGLALGVRGALEGAPELRLEQPVHPLDLLLLAELGAVAAELHAALTVLPRRIRAALDGALVGVAAVPLQVHLEVLAAADAAGAGGVAGQGGGSWGGARRGGASGARIRFEEWGGGR